MSKHNTTTDFAIDYSHFLEWKEEISWDISLPVTTRFLDGTEIDCSPTSNVGKFAMFDGHRNRRACIYCRSSLERPQQDTDTTMLARCNRCDWWFLFNKHCNVQRRKCGLIRESLYEGIVRRYDLTSASIPLNALRKHLERHPDHVFVVNPTAFEQLIGAVYRDFYDCEVRHIGGPGDNGVDLYAVISNEPHLIQVKRRTSATKTESVATVREFIGALIGYGVDKGHIVTTSGQFSPSARRLVSNPFLERHNISIELHNLNSIYAMLDLSNRRLKDPWEELL